jgi:hypothetical protein
MNEQPETRPNDSTPTRISRLAITSLVLGIIAIPTDILFFAGVLPGVLAIMLGSNALQQIRRSDALTGKSLALAGIILGVISLLLAAACGYALHASQF